MSRTTKVVLGAGYGMALAILAANAGFAYIHLETIVESNRRVDHTRQVIAALELASSDLKDAETGQRGYLLTGQESSLKPFREAVEELDPILDRLRSLTADNPEQSGRVGHIVSLVNEKRAELRRTLAVRDEQGLEAALAVFRANRGQGLMHQIRRLIAEMESAEERLLEQRMAASRHAVRGAVVTFVVTTLTGLTLLMTVFGLNWRAVVNTERAAGAVRLEREWLTTTLISIGDAVIATDADGIVKFMNPVATALTGWPQHEAAGRPLDHAFLIVNEQTRLTADNPIHRVLREGTVVGLANHTLLIARDGSERPIDDSAAPIRDAEGWVAGAVLVFRDVTEQRRYQQERERLLDAEHAARAAAEEANQTKDQFLAMLSHELRTPLNPILLAATAMLDNPPAPEEINANLAMIRQNIEVQARLIDDLLDVMRIVQGKMHLDRQVADMHELVRLAIEICRSEVLKKDLRLTTDFAATRGHVFADTTRLQQVFWNLIKNAVKFTPRGGAITIRSYNTPDDRLVIEVADDGIGIRPEFLRAIFDPFQQAETTIIRRFGGLGLGLAIGRGVIAAHDGTLTAESPGEGRGATFRVELESRAGPVLPIVELPTRGPAQRASSDVVPCRLLLVEDDPTTLRLMARLLREDGHEVTPADSIAAALAAAEERPPFDLVISDIGLPDGSGLDLIRRLINRQGPVPALALTGYGMESDIRKSRDAGFSTHMTKPIDFARLRAVIRRLGPSAEALQE